LFDVVFAWALGALAGGALRGALRTRDASIAR